MKSSIALAAAIVFCVVRAAAAEDGAGQGLVAVSSSTGPSTELHAPAAPDPIVRSEGSRAAVVLVFLMMTVIAYRRLDRTAP